MRKVLAGQVHGVGRVAVARSHLLASCCDVATIVPPELLCTVASDCAIALPSRRSAPYKRRAMSSHLRAILPLSHTIFASTALRRTLPHDAALCRTRVAVPLICSVTALRLLLSLSTEPPISNSSSHSSATLCRTVALCRPLPHSAALELPCPRTDQSQLFACFCRSRSCPRSVTALHMLLPHSAARCRTLPHSAALRRTQGGVGCCVDAQLVWWGLVLCRFMALQRLAHSPIPPHCSIYFETSSAVACCCSLS